MERSGCTLSNGARLDPDQYFLVVDLSLVFGLEYACLIDRAIHLKRTPPGEMGMPDPNTCSMRWFQ